MGTITVEWRHLDKEGKTCDRCAETGQGITEMLLRLREECRGKGVEILFTETKLSGAEITQSNLILINGTPLEAFLPQATASESNCCSCGELTGREESCRTIIRHGQAHEAIPPEFIREAICRVAGCC
ncbi:MAG: DUF2703 domain-containing protein [Desulfurivibrionaceae bacterium]|jgi:hypothetical protein|nr:DUF2703 domain-containing protein [Pseudomonadota bacterium]MCG2822566.1 DUF2703 domain-containing protein [Desulfobulbaceae bacterium]MDP2002632.1 DUF2703 domain-containing protein [Desulfurivibrionaceae bacterium]PKN21740.1 MAG: molybdenum cofactor biosysynthesis protein [Deltaproteobacteria bacterium HGW-Deltaproteobacteria-3]